MKKRLLGRTGISVSEIAFGGVSIGMPYANQPMPSESDAIHLLHKALENGINFYDTARLYGESESLMGKAFRHKRHDVIINTKCAHFLDAEGDIPAGSNLRKIINESFEESVRTLGTDYIDVFMLHQSSTRVIDYSDILEVFDDLKTTGKVRALGASNYLSEETRLCLERKFWDVIQVPFNLMDQRQNEHFQNAKDNGTGVMIRSALFRGMLTDKNHKLHTDLKKVENHIRLFKGLLDEEAPDLVTMATKFALSFAEVSSVLVGMDQLSHLSKALEVADGHYFEADRLQRLQELAYPQPEFLNLHQWDKNGWLKT